MSERSVAEQAADWVVELADTGAGGHAAFAQWLSESPRHVEEYLLASTMYKTLDHADTQRQMNVEEIIAATSLNVVALADATVVANSNEALEQKGRTRRHFALAALAATLAATIAILTVGAWWFVGENHPTYATGTGELRSIELGDGSRVELNTQSAIDVLYTEHARTIRLRRGEALFKVSHDAARPFVVHADAAVVQALGTEFNVYRRDHETAVAVIEGAVQVSSGSAAPAPAKLSAGEGAVVQHDGRISPISPLDAVKVTAWRQRRLVFVDDPLAHIVAEFNRYNSSPHLRVEGDYANKRELTAVFDASDPLSLIEFLRKLDEFSVVETSREITISAR